MTDSIKNGGDEAVAEYYGGAVISQPIHIYFIWYGSWTQQSVIQPILTDFINGLGTSDWWKSATEYFDEPSLNLIPDGGSFVSSSPRE